MTNETLSAQWRQRISDREKSGLSVRSYCATHEIPEHRYYYWYRRLFKPATTSQEVDWLGLAVPDSAGSTLTVRIGAASIDIASGFDAPLLSAIVSALSAGRC